MKRVILLGGAILTIGILLTYNGGTPKVNNDAHKIDNPKLIISKNIPPEWRGLAALVAARESTSADWKNLKVQGGTVEGKRISYGIALNVWPILEAEQNTNASHVYVSTERENDNAIITSVWGRKLNKRIRIDWSKGDIEGKPHDNQSGGMLGESPTQVDGRVSILFGDSPTNKSPCVAISTWKDNARTSSFFVPYQYDGFSLTSPYARTDYPVAGAIKVGSQPHEFSTIMLFDIELGTLIGEIALPPEARQTRPDFLLDIENDVLVAAGYDLRWIMAIDLRTYMKSRKIHENLENDKKKQNREKQTDY